MDLPSIIHRALEIRSLYAELEKKKYGAEWTEEQLVQGFKKDVEDLERLTKSSASKSEIGHELADCLWSICVIATKENVDLENAFEKTMNDLEARIKGELYN